MTTSSIITEYFVEVTNQNDTITFFGSDAISDSVLPVVLTLQAIPIN